MTLRPLVFGLAIAALCLAPLSAAPARAAEADVLKTKLEGDVIQRPRLLVTMAGTTAFMGKLGVAIEGSSRFQVVTNARAKTVLKANNITVDGKLSVEKARKAMGLVGADLILDGEAKDVAGAFRVTCRLYDLRTGEITRDLSLLGQSSDIEGMSSQLAAFVRHSVPLKTVVKSLMEDQVVLDLGATDGVREGTMFKVMRYPRNLKPREVGVVKVVKADPFVSMAEVESTVPGVTLEEGDMLVEQTASFLITP